MIAFKHANLEKSCLSHRIPFKCIEQYFEELHQLERGEFQVFATI